MKETEKKPLEVAGLDIMDGFYFELGRILAHILIIVIVGAISIPFILIYLNK